MKFRTQLLVAILALSASTQLYAKNGLPKNAKSIGINESIEGQTGRSKKRLFGGRVSKGEVSGQSTVTVIDKNGKEIVHKGDVKGKVKIVTKRDGTKVQTTRTKMVDENGHKIYSKKVVTTLKNPGSSERSVESKSSTKVFSAATK